MAVHYGIYGATNPIERDPAVQGAPRNDYHSARADAVDSRLTT